jgi:hypothetical protein
MGYNGTQTLTMSTPTHASAVCDADGLGLGVGEGVGADVVGDGDGELDLDTCADAVGAGLAGPRDSGAATRRREMSGVLVIGAESVVRCRASLRAVTR